MSTPKEDAQALIDEFMPLAEKWLSENQEFFPFGGKMNHEGEIIHESAYTGTEHPPSQDLIDIIRKSHSQDASKDKLKASCIVYDILTTPPNQAEKQDAIAFEIDHVDDYSVIVIFPYKFDPSNKLIIEKAFAVAGQNEIFKK